MRFSKSTVVICLFTNLVFLSGMMAAHAEFYRYKDENGAIRFTDDLAEVPEDQRPQLRVYDEPADFGIVPEKPAEEEAAKSDEKEPDRMTVYKALRAEEDELAKELEALNKEKAKLGDPAAKTYQKKVDQFNKKIAAYEKKRAAYNEKVKAFKRSQKKEE